MQMSENTAIAFRKDGLRPNWSYAKNFMDCAPQDIGIQARTAILLERYLDVTNVRELVAIKTSRLAEVPQLGSTQLRQIQSRLANIGVPVAGLKPNLAQVPVTPEEARKQYGMPWEEEFAVYRPY